ncbi:hypothetical protein B0H66DRAFT_111534 [Apodospora peruviana]|uniref:Meiotically up-regulated 65 protein n=1 Tax=Apodospora peruviana TaxID=516989 RepID=A0AAE0IHC4_9PEZI|nr:hypothetical protein B0H66DRAFT_111534 [Apodospora peruviana]
MPKIKHHRSSRRVPPPKDSDFDHEIGLVDHSANDAQSPTEDGDSLLPRSREANSVAGPSTARGDTPNSDTLVSVVPETQANGGKVDESVRIAAKGLSVQVEQPTPLEVDQQPKATHRMSTKPKPKTPEAEIDILYENQRGGFLCGMALFSSKALGNLDPPPWTNSVHKPSPTDITNAQVPDPSWEWAWPEWRINHDDGIDEDGWEYSFMFSKKFSWHKPAWWSSFVRRRAWIRKRVKKNYDALSAQGEGLDPSSMMLNPDYFTVRPSSELERSPSRVTTSSQQQQQRSHSQAPSSRKGSVRLSTVSTGVMDEIMQEDIESVDELLKVLRRSRIDREKIEAVDNYLEHAQEDLEGLQDVMHDVMAVFVFQASRRVLLTRLTEVYDRTVAELKKREEQKDKKTKGKQGDGESGNEDEDRHRKRVENLRKAIKHADEEVRRLEYWSDVRGMAEEGDTKGAVDPRQSWDSSWQGLDNSAPAQPAPPTSEDANGEGGK